MEHSTVSPVRYTGPFKSFAFISIMFFTNSVLKLTKCGRISLLAFVYMPHPHLGITENQQNETKYSHNFLNGVISMFLQEFIFYGQYVSFAFVSKIDMGIMR